MKVFIRGAHQAARPFTTMWKKDQARQHNEEVQTYGMLATNKSTRDKRRYGGDI